MENINAKKSLQNYFALEWEKAGVLVSSLAELGRKLGDLDIIGGSVWAYANTLQEMIKLDNTDKATMTLFPFEKSAVRLLEENVVNRTIETFRRMESTIFNVPVTDQSLADNFGQKDSVNVNKLKDEDFVLLAISDKIKSVWQKNYVFLAPDKRASFNKDWENAKSLVAVLQLELEQIAAVLGFSPGIIKTYTFDEVATILTSTDGYDILRMSRTLAELMNSENKKDATWILGEIFSWKDFYERKEYTWNEAFFFNLIMHLAYQTFSISDDGFRKGVARNYFYKAILVGVPVEEKISLFLYDNLSILTFVNVYRGLFEDLENNLELLPINDNKQQNYTFSSLLNKYFNFAGEDWEKKEKIEAFLRSLPITEIIVGKILFDAINIAVRLKNADIIDHTVGGELTEAEKRYNDTVLLFSWLGVGDGGVEPLEQYFKKPHPLVPLKAFLNHVREVVNLKDEVVIDNLVRFTGLLQKNNWLKDGMDLINFHEEDGSFHWNEEAFK